MKKVPAALILIVGLGSCFSFAQGSRQIDPFQRYLAGLKSNRHDAALARVAALCRMDLGTATVRYADRPGENWKLHKNLTRAQGDQETDFFATAAVWHAGRRILVEEWSMDLEAGDETRTLYCLLGPQVTSGEQIEWCSSNDEEANDATAAGWAYEIRWKVEQGKFFKSTLERFVNDREQPVPKPKLGPDAPTVFGLIPEVKTWSDLKLPDAMLQ